jgi:phosphate transport system substrate-binding protein
MKRTISILAAAAASTALLAGCGGAQNSSRDQIRVVGSSTVYPFAKVVADSLATSNAALESPIIESTGSGAGIKLFCAGVGTQHPDIVNSSRRMKKAEYDGCAQNGVTDIVEVQVGLDGLAFATAHSGVTVPLTTADVYKALAANPFGKPQTAKTWQDVNPALPALPILVYGPPSTSGTRDSLKELVLIKGCDSDPAMKALKESDSAKHETVCTEVRNDGAYVDSGENDNLIVQKLEANPRAIGVFGFSYLEENSDKLKGLPMNGVMPSYETVSDFSYPGARAMFVYVKAAHFGAIKGLKEFVAEWPKHWGPGGALARAGMIVSPDDVRARSAAAANQQTLLDPAQLK